MMSPWGRCSEEDTQPCYEKLSSPLPVPLPSVPQRSDTLLIRRQRIFLVPAEFGRTDAARFTVASEETHDGTDPHAKLLRRFRDGRTALDCFYNAPTQV